MVHGIIKIGVNTLKEKEKISNKIKRGILFSSLLFSTGLLANQPDLNVLKNIADARGATILNDPLYVNGNSSTENTLHYDKDKLKSCYPILVLWNGEQAITPLAISAWSKDTQELKFHSAGSGYAVAMFLDKLC